MRISFIILSVLVFTGCNQPGNTNNQPGGSDTVRAVSGSAPRQTRLGTTLLLFGTYRSACHPDEVIYIRTNEIDRSDDDQYLTWVRNKTYCCHVLTEQGSTWSDYDGKNPSFKYCISLMDEKDKNSFHSRENPAEIQFTINSERQITTANGCKWDWVNGEWKFFMGQNLDLHEEGDYKDGNPDFPQGAFKRYFWNGQIQDIITYKNGKEEGEVKRFYDNGQLESIIMVKNGVRNGPQVGYYKNGNIEYKGNNNDQGHETGEWTFYTESGKLEKSGMYSGKRPSEKTGEWKFYDAAGKLIKIWIYERDQLSDTNALYHR